jgi:ubiquinone biosynthesis protein
MITSSIHRPLDSMYRWIDPVPLGSASLAQTHRARLITCEKVVIKVLKPGVRNMIERDTKLLRFFARVMQLFFARYQPARVIDEFSAYTLREVDLRNEADNAETFAAYFRNEPDIRFPKIYRQYSNRDILCMEYFKGIQPDQNASSQLTREQKMTAIDQGIRAIIEMIYRDGFFHADLHPANLMIFKNHTVGFIDLGMVGKFDRDMRKRMFYYFFSLVMGDPDSAARYLTSIALPGRGGDLEGFRRAASDLYARWLRRPTFSEFSLAQVILESVLLAGQYNIQYPAEIILMVKALVTIEGVGNMLEPGLNVVVVARRHVQNILLQEFNPIRVARESILVFPEMVDLVTKSPLILAEGLKYLETTIKRPQPGPVSGIRATILAGFFLLSGAIMVAFSAPWWLWLPFFLIGFVIALRS